MGQHVVNPNKIIYNSKLKIDTLLFKILCRKFLDVHGRQVTSFNISTQSTTMMIHVNFAKIIMASTYT
jgi:hypothetical protein